MGKKKEDIYDDQYWYAKDREEHKEPEPKYEEQDKASGKDCSKPISELVDLTGHWFVSFGVEVDEAKMEGCRIITLKGRFDPDCLIDILTDKVQETLPDYAKELLAKYKQKVVLRAFNRIDPIGVVAAVPI